MILGFQATRSVDDRKFDPLNDCIPHDQMEERVWTHARGMYAAAQERYNGSARRTISDDDWYMVHNLLFAIAGADRIRRRYRARRFRTAEPLGDPSTPHIRQGYTRVIASPNFCWRRALLVFSRKARHPKRLNNFWVVSLPLTWGMQVMTSDTGHVTGLVAFRLSGVTATSLGSRKGLDSVFRQCTEAATAYPYIARRMCERRACRLPSDSCLQGLVSNSVLREHASGAAGHVLVMPRNVREAQYHVGLAANSDVHRRFRYFNTEYLQEGPAIRPWLVEPFWGINERYIHERFTPTYWSNGQHNLRNWPLLSGAQLFQKYGQSGNRAWSTLATPQYQPTRVIVINPLRAWPATGAPCLIIR